MIELKRRDPEQLGFEDLLNVTSSRLQGFSVSGREAEIAKAVQLRFAYALMDLINSDAPSGVKARASSALTQLDFGLTRRGDHGQWIKQEIMRFRDRPAASEVVIAPAKALPPGGPIGSTDDAPNMGQYETCWHCD